jgi:hypothetical protein
MESEIERLRDLIGRYARLVGDHEGTDFLETGWPPETEWPDRWLSREEAAEIAKYAAAARRPPTT